MQKYIMPSPLVGEGGGECNQSLRPLTRPLSRQGRGSVTSSLLCNAPLAPVFEVSIMQSLPAQGQQRVEAIAQRYGVSTDAVITLLDALIAGHGTMAQFTHPELGGSGQWMHGGMTMVGDMLNHALKAQVDGVCAELARLLAQQPGVMQSLSRQPHSQRQSGRQHLWSRGQPGGSRREWGNKPLVAR